jgi:predicted ATPase with chaperone activity
MLLTDASSDWKSLYEAAMREADSSRVGQRIAVARAAILAQIEKSIRNPALVDQRAMDNALRNLRRLARSLDSARSQVSA